MHAVTVHELPPFDSGQYEGSEFLIRGGGASLKIHVAELGTLSLEFSKDRWHQFTALPNCTAEMVQTAYFRVVEVASPELRSFIAADSTAAKAYSELHHYRIFLDETGCHEVFAQSFHAA